MNQVNFGYSTTVIQIPGNREYLQQVIGSAEKFVTSTRWQTFFYLKPKTTKANKKTIGFKSTKPLSNTEFEVGMFRMVQSVQFKKIETKFQHQQSKD